jgi:predicted dehydrogenase
LAPDRISVGLLGCGFIAHTHVRSFLEFPDEVRIAALCDRSGNCACDLREYIRTYAAQEAHRLSEALDRIDDAAERERLGARCAALRETASREMRVYSSRQELAGDPDVALVVNSTPPFVHYRSTLDLLEAGKHVLLEKPLAGSLRQTDRLIAAAESRGLCFSIVSQGRFADDQRRMRELVRQGKLGKVFLMKSDTHWWRRDDYYRVGWRGNWANECGGVLLNHAWHLLDQGLFIVGQPLARVYAQMGAFVHGVLRDKKVGATDVCRWQPGRGDRRSDAAHPAGAARGVRQPGRGSVEPLASRFAGRGLRIRGARMGRHLYRTDAAVLAAEPDQHPAVHGPVLAAHAAGARCAGCHPGWAPTTHLRPRGSVDAGGGPGHL